MLAGLWFDGQRFAHNPRPADVAERPDIPVFETTRRWLDIYFSGNRPEFTPPLILRTTPFRKRVWEALLSIPYGHTISYGELARRVGCKSAQAIGGAVGHNCIGLIIPCHRVIGSDGALTGYAAGLERKAKLLMMEGAIP